MSKELAAGFGIGLCIVIAVLAYLFHDTFGLTFGTAVRMAAPMVVLAIGTGALIFFAPEDSMWGPSSLWPLLSALFVACWFPALDEWSATWGTSIPSFLAYSDTAGFIQDPQWWATDWAKLLWLVIPLVGGYIWKFKDAIR